MFFGRVMMATVFAILISACSREQNFDEKVLNIIGIDKIKGFDPIYCADLYTGREIGKVYEPLLGFHYLKRPYELEANLAESLPTVSTDGLTYTFKLRKGVKFHDDKCFPGGKGREVTADDVLYSIRRLADPKLQSTGWWLLDGKIVGLNQWRDKHAQSGKPDYAESVAGLQKIDSHTFQFKLTKPFPQFLYALTMNFTAVVAHEAVETYGAEFQNHPVGTGPFVLNYFDNTNKIVYKRNPTYREKYYPSEGEPSDEAAGLLADAGKRLPLVDKVVVKIQIESSPRWLSFQKGLADHLAIPKDNFNEAVDKNGKLSVENQKKGMRLTITPQLDTTYIAFNHEDPLFKNNLKLRQAMSLAYDRNESNKLFYSNTAVVAESVIPPGIAGYKKEYRNPWTHKDLKLAKKLLAEAGYPGGKGLPVLTFDTAAGTVYRQMAEFFAKQMEEIGIKVKISINTWPELVKKTNTKRVQLFGMAWGGDYPDAENFLSLLYGPNEAPGNNSSNFKNAEFDKLYAQASVMQDGPDRTAIYEKMNELLGSQVPWIFCVHRSDSHLSQGWLRNFKYIEFDHFQAQYLNVDLEVKKELMKKY